MAALDRPKPAKPGLFSRLATFLGLKKKEAQILCVGLDNSGKSTLLNYMKPEGYKREDLAPTIGYSVEKFYAGRIQCTVFDMSGQGKSRALWEHYYKDAHAILFVVDSTDRIRMEVARDELNNLLHHADLVDRQVPILFLANKMDCKDALSAVEVSVNLCLHEIHSQSWHICATNAVTGEGVQEGISWVSEQIKNKL